MPAVDPFDVPVSSAGEPIADPFDAPPVDFSKLGEFDAKQASEGQRWRIALGYLTTPDQKARADIVRKVLPGAAVQMDPNNGRPVVTYKGETGYIDKPGITLGGVLDSIAQIGKFVPAGKFASGGANLLTQVGRAGAAGAATSVAEDVAAIPQGSEQGVDPERAAITGVAASAGQALSPVASKGVQWLSDKGVSAWKFLRGNPMAVNREGALTEFGKRWAQRAGLNPNEVTPQLATQLEDAARQAAKAGVPDEQAAGAVRREALSRRFRVPLTRGEVTGDYAQQSLEEGLKRADVTTKAGGIMREHETRAAEALRGEAGDTGFGMVRREINPQPAPDASWAGQQVLSATRGAARSDRAAYQGAYKSARESGAALDGRNYKEFVTNVEAGLKEAVDFDPNLYPQTAKVLENLRGRQAWMDTYGQGGMKVPLAKLENLRKIINAQWKSSDATDRMGLDYLRNQFDEMVNGAIESGRISGDKTGVEAWKAGRSLYQRFQELYAPSPKAGQAEQQAGRTVANWLKSDSVTGDDVIRDAVFNKALTKRVLDIHGEGSPAHTALKQGVLEYIFRPALKNEGISPRLVVSQFDRFFKGAQSEQMNAVFSTQDRRVIQEFVELCRAKIPQTGVVNFSNTGNMIAKTFQQIGSRLGLIAATGNVETALSLGALNAASGMRATAQAKEAVRGLTRRNALGPASVVTGASAGDQINE